MIFQSHVLFRRYKYLRKSSLIRIDIQSWTTTKLPSFIISDMYLFNLIFARLFSLLNRPMINGENSTSITLKKDGKISLQAGPPRVNSGSGKGCFPSPFLVLQYRQYLKNVYRSFLERLTMREPVIVVLLFYLISFVSSERNLARRSNSQLFKWCRR